MAYFDFPVVPDTREEAALRQRVREFLSQHLARFEVPRYILKSPTPLPRTASGKILKRELRDQAVASITH